MQDADVLGQVDDGVDITGLSWVLPSWGAQHYQTWKSAQK